jgi:hypothetical protein
MGCGASVPAQVAPVDAGADDRINSVTGSDRPGSAVGAAAAAAAAPPPPGGGGGPAPPAGAGGGDGGRRPDGGAPHATTGAGDGRMPVPPVGEGGGAGGPAAAGAGADTPPPARPAPGVAGGDPPAGAGRGTPPVPSRTGSNLVVEKPPTRRSSLLARLTRMASREVPKAALMAAAADAPGPGGDGGGAASGAGGSPHRDSPNRGSPVALSRDGSRDLLSKQSSGRSGGFLGRLTRSSSRDVPAAAPAAAAGGDAGAGAAAAPPAKAKRASLFGKMFQGRGAAARAVPEPAPVPVVEVKQEVKVKDESGNKRVNHFLMLEVVGRGAYGKVRRCIDEDTGAIRAVKIMRKSILKRKRIGRFSNALENAQREIAIWKKLDHPNVVKLYEVIDDETSDKLYLVGEYIDGGAVMPDETVVAATIPVADAARYAAMLVDGLTYLHFQRVIHRDVKPGNLLVERSTGILKITDFGVSQVIMEGAEDSFRNTPGTAAFLAPEMLTGDLFAGRNADVWAVGITLYMFLYGTTPFLAGTTHEVYDNIRRGAVPWPAVTAAGAPLDMAAVAPARDLVMRLLDPDPATRITLEDARQHPFLRGIGGTPRALPAAPVEVTAEEIAAAISRVVKLRAMVKAAVVARRQLAGARTRIKLRAAMAFATAAAASDGGGDGGGGGGDDAGTTSAAAPAAAAGGDDGAGEGDSTHRSMRDSVGSGKPSSPPLPAPLDRSATFKLKAEASFTGLDPEVLTVASAASSHRSLPPSPALDGQSDGASSGTRTAHDSSNLLSAGSVLSIRSDDTEAAMQTSDSDVSGESRRHIADAVAAHGGGMPRYRLYTAAGGSGDGDGGGGPMPSLPGAV